MSFYGVTPAITYWYFYTSGAFPLAYRDQVRLGRQTIYSVASRSGLPLQKTQLSKELSGFVERCQRKSRYS